MKNGNSITKLLHSDLAIAAQIHHVFQASYAVEAKLIGVQNFPPLQRTTTDLQNSKTSFIGFWEEKELAGVLELDEQAELADICSMIVHPNHFRKGIASQLLQYVLQTTTATTVIVETAVVNIPAINLYQKMNFKETKRFTNNVGIEKVAFCLELKK